jgi:Macrocin-O-methyltransferase (TylF)
MKRNGEGEYSRRKLFLIGLIVIMVASVGILVFRFRSTSDGAAATSGAEAAQWRQAVDFDKGEEPRQAHFASSDPADLYIDLMKFSLMNLIHEDDEGIRKLRFVGADVSTRTHTLIGVRRLDNLHRAIDDVLTRGVAGDLIEAGAGMGGATIFMRAMLKARRVTDRKVWVADSFEGFPKPNPELYPQDRHMDVGPMGAAYSIDAAKGRFARYGLLDDQVEFLKGWFKDTFPKAPIEKLAILRIDADLYESTTDALRILYDRVSPGGWIIVDDYGAYKSCKGAVDDFRQNQKISEELHVIDWTGVYWVKGA